MEKIELIPYWKSSVWHNEPHHKAFHLYESDLCSNEHYSSNRENKAWKKIQACTGLEPITSCNNSAVLYQPR